MKRCFIAIKIPADPSLLKFYQQLRSDFKDSSVNWVPTENLHLTLAFLGEISGEAINNTIYILDGIRAETYAFPCELKGFGSFGSRHNPSVLWIGIHTGSALQNLQKRISAKLIPLGYKPEGREFRPHLTLGRIKSFKSEAVIQAYSSKFGEHQFFEFMVDSLLLYESLLSSAGPVYKAIQKFEFMK